MLQPYVLAGSQESRCTSVVGAMVGALVGAVEGASVGATVGETVGVWVGASVGASVGESVGESVGLIVVFDATRGSLLVERKRFSIVDVDVDQANFSTPKYFYWHDGIDRHQANIGDK